MNNVTNIASGDAALSPDSYVLRSLTLTNHHGSSIELKDIYVKLVLTESLYSNTMFIELVVKDFHDTLSKLPINGMETIVVSLARKNHEYDTEDDVSLTFRATHYPLYGTAQQGVSVWEVHGVSPHAFTSGNMKISRAISGLTIDEINKIALNDLEIEGIAQGGSGISRMKGIINTMPPLKAIKWLSDMSYDVQNAPYYFYETLHGIALKSLTFLLAQDPIITLNDFKGSEGDYNTKFVYQQNMKKLLSIASDIRLDRPIQGLRGAWKNKNKFIDIANKTITSSLYDYEKDHTPMDAPIDQDYSVYNEDVLINHSSINTMSYGNSNNVETMLRDNKGIRIAKEEILDSIIHNIRVNGNMSMNAGTMINLSLHKKEDLTITNDSEHTDKALSGKYLITDSIHTFEDGKYYTEARIVREARGA